MVKLKKLSYQPIRAFLELRFAKFAEINRKYAKPRIKITRTVSIALFFLRIYLLLLVAILFYKFWTLLT